MKKRKKRKRKRKIHREEGFDKMMYSVGLLKIMLNSYWKI